MVRIVSASILLVCAENIFDNFLYIFVFVAVGRFTGGLRGIAVEQPVVVTGTGHFYRR